MENNANQLNQNLCKKNCGFFGNPAFDGYCSKCYKEHVKRQNTGSASGVASNVIQSPSNDNIIQQSLSSQQQQITSNISSNDLQTSLLIESNKENNEKSEEASTQNLIPHNQSADSLCSTASCSSNLSATEGEKKRRNRCAVDTCRRKLGLTGFDCRCGNLYCWEHRYSDKHNCQFDYKEFGQDQIRKNNPVVVGEKIQKL